MMYDPRFLLLRGTFPGCPRGLTSSDFVLVKFSPCTQLVPQRGGRRQIQGDRYELAARDVEPPAPHAEQPPEGHPWSHSSGVYCARRKREREREKI